MRISLIFFLAFSVFAFSESNSKLYNYVVCGDCPTGWNLEVLSPTGKGSFGLFDEKGFAKEDGEFSPRAVAQGNIVIIYGAQARVDRMIAVDFSSSPRLLIDLDVDNAVSALDGREWAVQLASPNRRTAPKSVGYVDFGSEKKFVLVFNGLLAKKNDKDPAVYSGRKPDTERVYGLHWNPTGKEFIFIDSLDSKQNLIRVIIHGTDYKLFKDVIRQKIPRNFEEVEWAEDHFVEFRKVGSHGGGIKVRLPER